MAANEYQGSIAQKYILFVTTLVVTVVPGQNFYAVEIFIDQNDVATNFVSGAQPAVDTVTAITAQNYTSILQGSMLAWVTGFYALNANVVSTIYFATFSDTGYATGSSAADLGSSYVLFNQYGYWKLIYDSTYKQKANVQLAALCVGDPLSQFVYGSSDATSLTGVATELKWFTAASPAPLDIPFIYHWNPNINPALVQLGATLAIANSSGTPVGNKTDFLAITGFSPSGSSVAGIANLNAVQLGFAQGSNICFFTYVGDGTGRVVAEKWVTCISKTLIGATWLVNFIDTVSSTLTTGFLVASPTSGFKNNDTYQGILNILQVELNLFSGMGRLLNVLITAPPFNKLPTASGGVITVPNAWSATYADNVRSTTIYGTLLIQA
jgi:hypothetical protein